MNLKQLESLSSAELRIKVAELRGWKNIYYGQLGYHGCGYNCWNGDPPYQSKVHVEIPDYLNDLNAMNSAESILTEEQGCRYRELLYLVVKADPSHDNDQGIGYVPAVCHATALQRAKAFVLTMG